MKTKYVLIALLACLIISCDSNKNKTSKATIETVKDSVAFSFTFLGCNRVDRKQVGDTTATNASTANLSAMKRIWSEISELKRKPDLFFFLGDLVLAETDTTNLTNQQTRIGVTTTAKTNMQNKIGQMDRLNRIKAMAINQSK